MVTSQVKWDQLVLSKSLLCAYAYETSFKKTSLIMTLCWSVSFYFKEQNQSQYIFKQKPYIFWKKKQYQRMGNQLKNAKYYTKDNW